MTRIHPVAWLYVPGDRPERFDNAAGSGADVVIIDLEDAVLPPKKDEALANAIDYLHGRGSEAKAPEFHVRTNDASTARGRDDITALVGVDGLHALRLPKVESARELDFVDEVFGGQAMCAYALLESAAGLAHVADIARHPRTAGVALGEQDLALELSLTSPLAFQYLRLQLVLQAAAAGLPPPPMSVFTDLRNDDALAASCRDGRSIGMFGRCALHPRQIETIKAAFAPSADEVAQANKVLAASRAAAGEEIGAYTLSDGSFVDGPIVARAHRVLELAERLGRPATPSSVTKEG